MNSQAINTFDRLIYITVSIFLLSLAYSEALKSISLVLILALLLYALISGRAKISMDGINSAIILHVLFVVVGVWFGINAEESIKQFSDVLKILLVFLFFREIDFKLLDFEKLLNLLLYGFIFALALGLYAYYFQGMDFVKLRSVGSINRSAVYMVLILMLLLPLIYGNNRVHIFKGVVAGLTIVGIILAASRMAMFSLPALLLLFLYLKNLLKFRYIVAIAIASALFVMMIPELFPGTRLAARLDQGFSDPARIEIWMASIKYFIDNNILFGIGVGNSIFINPQDYYGSDALFSMVDNTHQLYLDMLLERGLLGFATFIGFIGLIMRHSWTFLERHPIYTSVLLMSSSILLMGFANITFRYEFGLLFVTIVGLSLNKSLRLSSQQ